jgi:uncharacterized protein (TIGR04255 family)
MTSEAGEGVTLPTYARPPVVEVALGVSFRPLASALDFGALADLRARWHADYPLTQQHTTLPPTSFLGHRTFPTIVEVGAVPIRVWLLNETQDRLVQVQEDRLVANWRAAGGSGLYPRYEALRSDFDARWDDFQQFMEERAPGGVRPTAVEVTYINVVKPEVLSEEPELSDVMRNQLPIESHLGKPVQASSTYVFDTSKVDGYQSQLNVVSNLDATGTSQSLVVQISALAAVNESKEIFVAMDAAHQHVVQFFDEITAESMRELWGRST